MKMDIQLKNALDIKRKNLMLDLQKKRDKIHYLNEEISEIEKDIVYINSLIRDKQSKIDINNGQAKKNHCRGWG